MNARFQTAFVNMFTHNFFAQKGEKVLLLADSEPFDSINPGDITRQTLLELAAAAAESLGLSATICTYKAQGSHGSEPPAPVWETVFGTAFGRLAPDMQQRLLNKTALPQDEEALAKTWQHSEASCADIILVLSHFSLSHTRFRSLTNRLTGARIATMPTFLPGQLLGVMSADWPAVAKRSQLAATLLSDADSVRIKSGTNCELRLGLKGRPGLADTGLLAKKGIFGNLPGGEGFVAPVEGSAQGSFVAYAADGKSLMTFEVRDGLFEAVSLPQDPSVSSLLDLIRNTPEVRNLAELGIGTNEKAKDTANILEGEKILGTCHIAFGDNKGFGGTVSAPFHRDYIVPAATLILEFATREPVVLLNKGRWRG